MLRKVSWQFVTGIPEQHTTPILQVEPLKEESLETNRTESFLSLTTLMGSVKKKKKTLLYDCDFRFR